MHAIKRGLAFLTAILFSCSWAAGAKAAAVQGIPAGQGVFLYPGHAEFAQGSTLKLYAYAVPEEQAAAFTWETSNPEVAGVDSNGIITAHAQGEAAITASLARDPAQKAVCTIRVKEEGSTLLYGAAPSDPPDDPPAGPGEGFTAPSGEELPGDEEAGENPPAEESGEQGESQEAEDNIPVEHDDSIPVEVIPSIDEFIWTIQIDDVYDWQSTQGGFVMHVLNRLQFKGVKHGGKTPFGEYKCTGNLEVGYPEGELDAYLSDSEVVAKTKFNPTGIINEFVCQVKPMDAGALYPNSSDPLLKTILKANYTGMAIGEIALETAGGGQITLTGKDGTVTGTHKLSLTAVFPYKLRIGKSGFVTLSYETKAKENGIFTFKGKLFKTPIRPE